MGNLADVDTMGKLEYNVLNYIKNEGFDNAAKRLFKELLSVIDDGHTIFICHPRHIFNQDYLFYTSETNEALDFDDIDFSKMLRYGDYGEFYLPDINEAFKYVHNRFRHEIMKAIKTGNNNVVRHLAVVERYYLDGIANYVIRGIIRGTKDGYAIAFNPEYKGTYPKNTFDKSLRFSGENIPDIHLKKRKNSEK